MDYANKQRLGSNPMVLELQQRYQFMVHLASSIRIEPQQVLKDDNDAPTDYWGDGWSDNDDDDELAEDQSVRPTVHREHSHDDDYYAKWSEHLDNTSFRSVQQKQTENNLAALQELTRLLQQTLPSASKSMSTLNPLPKAIQYRYEWDEPNH